MKKKEEKPKKEKKPYIDKNAQRAAEIEKEIQEWMVRFYADPLSFVIFAYPWETDPSIQVAKLQEPWKSRYKIEFGPDKWACEFLEDLGRQVKTRKFDGRTPVTPIRMATASGHGIGKSGMVAWLVDWIMSTRPNAQGTVTANTSMQLSTKTWPQIVKWTEKCITRHWFRMTSGQGSMMMTHLDAPKEWFCSAQTCRKENSEAFAGQHAPTSTSFYIFDEGSAIDRVIYEVAEGGLTDGEPMEFAFGNPTQNTGPFYDFFTKLRGRWVTRQIDSRDVQITNKGFIQELIDDYGVDSDFVKVRVRGMFPSMSFRQFISTEDVDKAFGRSLRPDQYEFAPVILTCDPAWEGDDELVIGKRQGLAFSILRAMPKNDNDMQVATVLASLEDEHKADAVYIDGGFGTGIISAGRTMKRNWRIVWFSEASSDNGCLNKRAQMWKLMRDWLKEGGCIPKDQTLYQDLIGPELIPRADGKIQLESKKDMKARGIPSPGRGDALALSFAYPISKSAKSKAYMKNSSETRYMEWDPFSYL